MNIAIYARVSSDTQTKEGTIDSQIEALREYAKAHNLKIVDECLDNGYSGTTLDRPGLDLLRNLVKEGSIEGILILAPDRLSRTQVHQMLLMNEFKKRDIQVIFTNQNFDSSDEGNLAFNVLGLFAEYERAKIADRMRRGTVHAIKNGQINGGNPAYGYRYVPKTKDKVGHWVINPEEEKIVKYIYDLYINERLSATAIVKRLNDEAIPCRSSRWWSRQIFSILQREFYIGVAYMFRRKAVEPKRHAKTKDYYKRKNRSRVMRPREDWIEIPVPAIIDRETWEKAQARKLENARTSKRNNSKNHYLLRGLVVCGLCGSMAPGTVSNKSTYYKCRAKSSNNVHSKPHDELIQVRHPSFDDKVWTGLTELLSDPKKMKAQLEKRIQPRKDKAPAGQPANEIDQELDKLAAQEQRMITAYRQEVINLDELKIQKGIIADRRKVLETKKKALQSRTDAPEQPKITMPMLGDVSARFQRVMTKADFQTREKITNRLVNSISLFTKKAIVKGNIPVDKFDALSPLPQGGGAKTILIPSLALETQHAIKQKRNQAHALSFRRGANGHADQSRQSGRGHSTPRTTTPIGVRSLTPIHHPNHRQFPPPFGLDAQHNKKTPRFPRSSFSILLMVRLDTRFYSAH